MEACRASWQRADLRAWPTAAGPDTLDAMMVDERQALAAYLLKIQSVAARQQEALSELGHTCNRLRAQAVLQERQAADAIGRLQEDLFARDNDLAELRRRLASLDGQLTGVQEEISRIYASKAWRVMAPARWLRAKMMPRPPGGA